MASFIYALSLFILVLSNGCLTLPIDDEQVSASTLPSLNDEFTTERTFNLRLVSDNEAATVPDMMKEHSSNEHMGFDMTTSTDNLFEENASRASRTFDEWSTVEPFTFTTEQSFPDKRDHHEVSFSTSEPTTDVGELDIRAFSESENEPGTEHNKREMQVELATSDMLLFTSTSSAVAPQLYTPEPSTPSSTSTKKYIGRLTDDDEQEEVKKPTKTQRKTAPKSKETVTEAQPEDKSEEEVKKPTKTQRKTAPKSKEIVTEAQPEDKEEEDSKVTTTEAEPEDKSEEDSEATATKKWKTESKDKSEEDSKVTTTKSWKTESKDKSEEDSKVTTTKSWETESKDRLEEDSKVSTTKSWKTQSKDKSEEDSKDLAAPIAFFDQGALDNIRNVPNDFLVLDETNNIVVTGVPDKLSATTMENMKEEKPLNQGEKPSHSEEKESDH